MTLEEIIKIKLEADERYLDTAKDSLRDAEDKFKGAQSYVDYLEGRISTFEELLKSYEQEKPNPA